MALDIWFAQDIRQGLAGALALTVEEATANGPPNANFVRGVVAMARAEALAYGLDWQAVIADIRAATGGTYALLLEAERAPTG
jgi:hypothetical protein